MKKKTKKKVKKWEKMRKKTQECLNNICIRFPTYENKCYAKRTRILRTMLPAKKTAFLPMTHPHVFLRVSHNYFSSLFPTLGPSSCRLFGSSIRVASESPSNGSDFPRSR